MGVGGVERVVERLRARRGELEQAIGEAIRDVAPSAAAERDAEYVAGLRVAVSIAVDYGLANLSRRHRAPGAIPPDLIAQAHRAARIGISLDAVLRRYIIGNALFVDFVMEEAHRAGCDPALRAILRSQASLLERLLAAVSCAHVDEGNRLARSREHRVAERVQALLSGEWSSPVSPDDPDFPMGAYELDGEHLGVIARGADAQNTLRTLSGILDRRLLCVVRGHDTAWAWLGGRRTLESTEFARALARLELEGVQPSTLVAASSTGAESGLRQTSTRAAVSTHASSSVSFAVGESATGIEGWRLTHRQAQAALLVALRSPKRLTRYADVALLATALKDDLLARSLAAAYLAPLDGTGTDGPMLRRTLRAYLGAARNVSAAASALGVARTTIERRLCAVEERLGRPLHTCSAELEVALRLEALDGGARTICTD